MAFQASQVLLFAKSACHAVSGNAETQPNQVCAALNLLLPKGCALGDAQGGGHWGLSGSSQVYSSCWLTAGGAEGGPGGVLVLALLSHLPDRCKPACL